MSAWAVCADLLAAPTGIATPTPTPFSTETATPIAPTAIQSTLDPLLANNEIEQVRISPDGKHLAVAFIKENQASLAILERATKKLILGRRLEKDFQIGGLIWANATRLIYTSVYSTGYLTNRPERQSIHAINVDGSGERQLFPEPGNSDSRGQRDFTVGRAYLLSLQLLEDRYLVFHEVKADRHETKNLIRKVDVFTGRYSFEPEVPMADGA